MPVLPQMLDTGHIEDVEAFAGVVVVLDGVGRAAWVVHREIEARGGLASTIAGSSPKIG